MEAVEDYAKRSERVKALLSSYYGDSGPSPAAPPGAPTQPGAPSGRSQTAVNLGGIAAIDTPAFNADQHTSNILGIFSLEKLMVEHRNMAREIKNIDSDMQQLVYENYNKFITATDTIRSMKSSIDSMESEMHRLQQTASVVAEKSLSVSTKLQQRRESMEQLYKVQRLLRKLQTVFELPRKMRAALEEDALDTAVGLYAEAQPLLHKYGGRGSFKVIALESDFVAQEISSLLKRRLTERRGGGGADDDAEQCVLLLRKLGEPDDTLQDKYLSGRVARIRRVLAEAALVADAMAAAAAAASSGAGGQPTPTPVPPPPKAQLAAPESWGWTGGAPPQLRTFMRALDEKFINGVQETVVNVIRFFLPEGAEDGPEAAASKRKPLVTLSRDLFAEYFAIVRRVVTDAAKAGVLRGSLLREARAEAARAAGPGGGGAVAALSVSSPSLQQLSSDWGAEAIAQALSTMSTDVGLLAAHLPELSLRERALEVVQASIQQHVTLSFAALKQRIIDAAVAVRTGLAADGGSGASGAEGAGGGGGLAGSGTVAVLQAGSGQLVELLQRGLAVLLQGLRGYESGGGSRLLAPWRDQWVDLVQGGLQGFFGGLLLASLELAALRYDGGDLMREALKASGAAGGGLAGAGGPDLMGPPGAAGGTPGAAQELVKPGLVLLLAKMCKFLEQVMVPWVMETIAANFASAGGPGGGGGGGPGGGDLPPSFVPGEVARRLSAASSAMVLLYVEMQGRQLSVMVRRSTASVSWLACKEPRGPRPVCALLLERLARVEAEAAGLLEEPGLGLGMGVGAQGHGKDDPREPGGPAASLYGSSSAFGGGGDSSAVERNVAKLFREKVHMTGSVALSPPAILAAIASVALKSLLESIRLETLGRAGLQQLQLDVSSLRPPLRRFLLRGGGGRGEGAAVVEQLLEDVVMAATERCVEPQLLEAAVVERILASASSSER